MGSEMCIRDRTKRYETIVQGCLGDIITQLDPQPKGEFVLLIAGAEETQTPEQSELDHHLSILLAELPLKQAVSLTASLLKLPKNKIYQHALTMNN